MTQKNHARWWGLWLGLGLLLALCAYPYLSQAVFSDDDGHILQLAIDAPYLGAYYMHEVYQQLSVVHYTPMALTVYRLMFELFGVTATPFLILQIGLLGLCAALAGAWCHRHTQQVSAGLMAILLIASLSSVWPMAARFYTLHYGLGALFSLLLLLHLQKKPPITATLQTLALATSFVLALLALMSKEIYAPLVLALWGWTVFRRHTPQAMGLLLAMLVYAGLRLHVLGFSTEGRTGNSLLGDLLSLQADTLVHFAKWYVQTHALLLLATVLALVLSPLQTLKNILIACLLVLPVLAAPHAFKAPTLHADRLFFAFDLAMCCALALALHSKAAAPHWPKWVLLLALPWGVFSTHAAMQSKQELLANDPSQKITRQILNAQTLQPMTILTWPDYQQGGLMRLMARQGMPLRITQNCQEALLAQSQGQEIWRFDRQGQRLDPLRLSESCQPLLGHGPEPVTEIIHPAFINGVLQWQLQASPALQIGIQFPDRGMTLSASHMRERLVRPRNGEPYRLYAHQGTQWWFSELRHMNVQAR
jgi:hypothetical protein